MLGRPNQDSRCPLSRCYHGSTASSAKLLIDVALTSNAVKEVPEDRSGHGPDKSMVYRDYGLDEENTNESVSSFQT